MNPDPDRSTMNCSVARTLALIGDQWTLLILRELFWGTTRFEAFRRHLAIARNILTDRLGRLVDNGLVERRALSAGGRRAEYRLTKAGRDLQPVILSLMQWGDQWLAGDAGPPVEFVDRATGRPIERLQPRSEDGRALRARDIAVRAGPGANAETRERIAGLAARPSGD